MEPRKWILIVALLVGFTLLFPVTGWSEPPTTTGSLAERVATLEALVASLQAQLTSGDAATLASAKAYTDSMIPASDPFLTNLKSYMTVDTTNHRITFGKPGQGVNVQLVDGSDDTYSVPPNGLGNLIIGYDALRVEGDFLECSLGILDESQCSNPYIWALNHKTGSHNLVIGDYHNYPRSGGFVAGYHNTINNNYATVSGGANNTAGAEYSSVSGGSANHAIGYISAVSGGNNNTASGNYSAVSGGLSNLAGGELSTVSGGSGNTAEISGSHVP